MTRIRVLVVDDSVVVRRLVTDALASDPAIEVVGTAANGQIAQTKIEQHDPDVVTMDIEMPVMDGIEAVRVLRRTRPRLPVIMFSTLTERGAVATLDALAAGATDYVTKPSNVGSVQESLTQVSAQLIPRIKALAPHRRTALAALPGTGRPTGRPAAGTARPAPRPRPAPHPIAAVVVGSSTGGPEALSRIFGALEAPLPVPVLITQHMPALFTRQLAARLDRIGPSHVVEAAGGEVLRPGTVYVAPGDHHLEVTAGRGGPQTSLHQGPQVNFCRPAVDVLIRSAVRVFGGRLLGVMLTGMGSDGRSACTDLVAAGGTLIAQDEATSVVWGMPGAVTTAGLTHALLPLDAIAAAITREVAEAPRTVAAGSRP